MLPGDFRRRLGAKPCDAFWIWRIRQSLQRVNKAEVLENLKPKGIFVQMPPEDVLLRLKAKLNMAEAQQNKWQ